MTKRALLIEPDKRACEAEETVVDVPRLKALLHQPDAQVTDKAMILELLDILRDEAVSALQGKTAY